MGPMLRLCFIVLPYCKTNEPTHDNLLQFCTPAERNYWNNETGLITRMPSRLGIAIRPLLIVTLLTIIVKSAYSLFLLIS